MLLSRTFNSNVRTLTLPAEGLFQSRSHQSCKTGQYFSCKLLGYTGLLAQSCQLQKPMFRTTAGQFHCAGRNGSNRCPVLAVFVGRALQCFGLGLFGGFCKTFLRSHRHTTHACLMQPLPPAVARFENVIAELVDLNTHLQV